MIQLAMLVYQRVCTVYVQKSPFNNYVMDGNSLKYFLMFVPIWEMIQVDQFFQMG